MIPADPEGNDMQSRRPIRLPRGSWPVLLLSVLGSGCADAESSESDVSLEELMATTSGDYCSLPPQTSEVLTSRPGPGEAPVDDVNWFARPVEHEGPDRIVAFASHNENYLYNLTQGVRVRIPDRSDAVATPDGRFMTVPSSYTPDSNVRFYPMGPLLEALAEGSDADDVEPAFIHEHPSMKRVYYQSTGVVSQRRQYDELIVHYRLMFSGGHDESNFRIADYQFKLDRHSGDLVSAEAFGPMALCPEVRNDLNTPFISKDGRYVAAYTSDSAENEYSPGASLKVFQITSTNPEAGTTTCGEVIDFGFAAGKADFSFDGSMLTFHISQGGYLTPFVNGGLPETTITDVVVAALELSDDGDIVGAGELRRLTTSFKAGVGSYFPAFFPDGTVFYVANTVPRESEKEKRFHLQVMDPDPGWWRDNVFASDEERVGWEAIESLWEAACLPQVPGLDAPPFPLQPHEAPWLALSLGAGQCHALLEDSRVASSGRVDWDSLMELCSSLESAP